MKSAEKNWHINQADLIRADERTIRNGDYSLAKHYYEVGARLTETYGVFDGSTERCIPVSDKAELARIYGVPISKISEARRVVKHAPSIDIFDSVLEGYGSWTAIVNGWLLERTPQQKLTQKRQERETPSRTHISNVPDKLRDGLLELGLTREDARKAVYEFLANATPSEIKLIWEARTGKRLAA